MFRAGDRVGVAVSGGADSVFLLHALHELVSTWNLQLSVVHLDHGIRGEASVADAEFVQRMAESFALPFHLQRADLRAVADNLEQAARHARQAFYQDLLASGLADRIATGHTRSDQAETVLYRLLRGASLAGLAGILPVTKEGLVRPLLQLTRAEIEGWLCERGLEWREDETNQDRSYARNRLRHEILPLLREGFNPRLDEALANLATLAQDEERYWQGQLDQRPAPVSPPPILNASELAGLPRALARRLIRRAIGRAKGDLRQIEFAHVERILDMAASSEGHDRVQIPALDVFRSFEWIRFIGPEAAGGPKRDFSLPLQAPGSVELPDGSTRITLQVLEKAEATEACVTVGNELDWQRLRSLHETGCGLELRSWRPGDQYRPIGLSKEQKIKVLFQEGRIPLWERRNWPIITYNGVILWARRFGAAAEFAAGPRTRVVLRVDESSHGNRTWQAGFGV
ncbi:MAG TPA: tRNA lysidine(34) synthetase TilS [Bryobacteraceae bacterium]|nr:tRNA lysidine(34) synthetase TilS [Bryobacteraceae bacterium]